jgi:hypothetical protein
LNFLLSLLLLAAGQTGYKSYTNHNAFQSKSVTALETTFSIVNQTSVNVGWVTVHLSGSADVQIDVTGSGTFSVNISDTPVSCTINAQSFTEGSPTWIIIDAHTSVLVDWNGSIVTVEDSESY